MSTKAKGGKAFIVVGATGMGKTTWLKNMLRTVHPENLFLYDVNAEYTELYNAPLPDFDKFSDEAKHKRESVIVFEEATIFLNNRGSNVSLIDVLVRKRHTKNIVFLVFHSFRAVPKYIIDLCNYMVIHKTNDTVDLVARYKNDTITKAFSEILAAPMIVAENGSEYSPSKIISLN